MKLLILITALMCFSGARAGIEPKGVEVELEGLAKKHGVQLKDLTMFATTGEGDDLKTLIDLNAKQSRIPASITKIATASAVLANFPPGYKFKTQLLSFAEIKNGTLKGNLYLKGGGDPSFVSENMWYLVNAFRRNKIKKIEGDLVVDDSLFDKMRYDLSRQKERVDRAYDAPVGAMSFNWNSVNIFVRPDSSGSEGHVFIDPENDYVRLVSKVKTVSGNENKLIADRKEDSKFEGDVIHVGGSIGRGNREITIFKNVTQPDLWAGYNLRSFLAQRGIEVTGSIKNGVTPEKALVLAESESKSIEQILADMNKFSNNYVSEMLTKNLGTLRRSTGATLADGVVLINEHLKNLGLSEDQYHIESPSGLTHENRISSYAMWKILQHLRNDFRVQPEFLTTLPIAGVDGTLKKRMTNSAAERWVRAKTGYVNNVVSLAGYAGLQDGHVVTFSFIYNGSTDETKVRQFFDKLLIFLVK